MVYRVTCFLCGYEQDIAAQQHDYKDWQRGKYAQDAFPYLSAGEREMLISKTCESCFDSLFGEEE